jgi:vancomycin permeability regulator SanA
VIVQADVAARGGRRTWWWALLMLAPALAVAPFAWLVLSTGDRRSSPERVPTRPVALVLGAGVRPDGTPSLLLARRLDLAVDLYRRGRVEAVLVSGNNSADSRRETDVMRAYLLAAGVPDRKIASDPGGVDTWESCRRASTLFGVHSATVVTQNFHLPRAVALCRAAGIDSSGVGDASLDVRRIATVYGYAREVPAAVKALLDVILRPAPATAGSPDTALARALDAPR